MDTIGISKKIAGELHRKHEERREARVYSGINDLPTGFSSRDVTPGCIVFEGGGFRGLYTGGVIDVLLENDLNFQSTIGVSAGALYGCCYVSGQLGSARINLQYRHDDRYVGGRAILKNHGIMGWDFLFGDLALSSTEANRRFYSDDRRFVAVVSNLETGKAEYLEKGDAEHESCHDIIRALCASASLPYVSEPVVMEGRHYLDGGCCDKIPIKWALDQGYDKIVVVRTRDRSYRKAVKAASQAAAHVAYGKNYPAFADALAASDADYNSLCDELDRLEAEGRIFCIAPLKPVEVGRMEGDMEKLGELYRLGYDNAAACLDKLQEYLAK